MDNTLAKTQRKEQGSWQIYLAIILFVLLCVLPYIAFVLWPGLFPAPLNRDNYMNGKMIIAWRETVKENIPDPLDSKKSIKMVYTKIHFVSSGKTFPEGDVMQAVTGYSAVCGYADGVADIFKVFDADPGGILVWSYRGNIVMGDKECPFGETIPYPNYDPYLDPEGFSEKVGLFQDCWISTFSPEGLQNKVRCGQSKYVGYANIKSAAPPGNSPEVFHFIVISDDGISAVPFSHVQEVLGRSGIQITLNDFFQIIKQINDDPENPAYVPFWQSLRFGWGN